MLLPNGKECVDMRKEPCYMEFNTSTLKCGQPMSNRQTKMVCCCSMGVSFISSVLFNSKRQLSNVLYQSIASLG